MFLPISGRWFLSKKNGNLFIFRWFLVFDGIFDGKFFFLFLGGAWHNMYMYRSCDISPRKTDESNNDVGFFMARLDEEQQKTPALAPSWLQIVGWL